MSGTRLDGDFARAQAVWLAAKKLAQHPTMEGLLGRLALFAQPAPQRASLMDRLIPRENPLHAQITTALDVLNPGEGTLGQRADQLGDVKATEVALSVCYLQVVRTLAPLSGLDASPFFAQAIAVATASEIFAERSRRFEPLEAYGAGLFHHLGILLMGAAHIQSYRATLQAASGPQAELSEIERANYGCAHDEVGAAVGDAWALPPHITDGMRFHETGPSGHRTVGLCVALASRLCHSLGCDAGIGGKRPAFDSSILRSVGVGEQNFERTVEIIRSQVRAFEFVATELNSPAA